MYPSSSKKMVRMVARKRRITRRPLRRLAKPLRNLYKFKRQGGVTFVTWKYDATNGVVVNTSGFIAKGAVATSTLTSAGGLTGYYDIGLAQWFQLSDLPSYTDFTGLYDRYRITGVKLQITYLDNTAPVSGNTLLPMLNYAIDYDDNGVPASEAVMQEKQDNKTRVLYANRPITVYIKNPRNIQAVQNNAGTFDAGLVSKGYINSSYPTVKHNGIKYWLSGMNNSSASTQGCIRIVPTYYITCKDPQ